MAKYIGPSCKLCRRENVKLFLKGTKCVTDKCPFNNRGYRPGQHGKRRQKVTNYGLQLREKQKVKRLYGILEKQFRLYFKKAARSKGITGHILLQLLERRLDNVVFRLCLAKSRAQARQVVKHGLIYVNDKRVDIPSFLVSSQDVVRLKQTDRYLKSARETYELVKERGIPAWLKADVKECKAIVDRLPERDEIEFPIQEQLIVELYSK